MRTAPHLALAIPPDALEPDPRRHLEPVPDAVGTPDLAGLLEAVGGDLGDAVLVTDERLRVLAHHVNTGDLDDAVRDWIVLRTPSAALCEKLPARGRLLGVGRTGDVLTGDGWTAAVVRVGHEVLGAVWTLDATMPDPARIALLTGTARRAAGAMTRTVPVTCPEQRRRGAVLRGGLDREASAGAVADELGLTADALRLMAFAAPGEPAAARLENLIWQRIQAAGTAAATTRVSATVYVFLGADLDATILDAATRRAAPGGADLRCAISEALNLTENVALAREDLDRLLEIGTRPTNRVDEHRSALVLAELTELAVRHPGLRRGAVARLAELDATGQTSYLPTLRAFFAAGHDLQRAADRLFVHRNTLRYRLERIGVLTGLDVFDPVQQLVADLQLRVHDATCPSPEDQQ